MERSVYGPIKTHIRAAIVGWELASPRKTLSISDITAIITRVLPLAITSQNIMAGFKECGVFPLNPDIFRDSSVTGRLISSEIHPYGEPASIYNGGGCSYDAGNFSDAALARDVQVNTSNTHDVQACRHLQDLSTSSHNPAAGLPVTESGQLESHLISSEPVDDLEQLKTQCDQTPHHPLNSAESTDDEGVCKVCREPFTQSSLEAVCLQCVLHRKWGEDDDRELSLVTPPDTEPHSDYEPTHPMEEATQDIYKDICDLKKHSVSGSCPTRNSQNPSLSLAEDLFSIASAIQPQNVLEPAHSIEVSSVHDIHKDTPDLQDHSCINSSPNHDVHDHFSATDPAQDIDNSSTHCASTITNEMANHPHNTAVSFPCVENHTHKDMASTHSPMDLASTPDIEDQLNIDSIPNCASVQDPTNEVEQPNSDPHVPESSRLSPTPELSTTQCGQMSHHLLDSPEPSGEREGSCKLCRESLTHSSSKAVCFQCMLHRKWEEDDEMDLSLVPPPDTEPQSDYEPVCNTENTSDGVYMDIQDPHKHTCGELAPSDSVQKHCETKPQSTGEFKNGHNHSSALAITTETPNHTHNTTVSFHNTKDHIHTTTVSIHDTDDHAHTTEGHTLITTASSHNTEDHTLNTTAPSHISGDHTHITTTSTYISEDHTHITTASSNLSEDQTKRTTISAHRMENHTLIDSETTRGVYGHTQGDALPSGDGQDHPYGTHQKEQPHSTPCVSLSPTPGPSTSAGGQTVGHTDSPESSDEEEGFCQVCQEPFAHSNSEVVCLQCVLHRKWGQSGSYI